MIRRVLIVEDDRKIARVVALYLEEAGYRVVVAESGRTALDAAAKEKPLLVILDMMLPDVGGEQVIQELKALGDIPVIILTSNSSEEDRVVGFALGADDYGQVVADTQTALASLPRGLNGCGRAPS